MAVTRPNAATVDVQTISSSAHSFSHTVTVDTTLLLVIGGTNSSKPISGTPSWDSNSLTEIATVGDTGVSADAYLTAWGLIDPLNKAGTCAMQFNGTPNAAASWVACINLKGTVISSVGAAAIAREEVTNNVGLSSTTAFASAGTSGNALIAAASFIGDDGNAASNASSFTEIVDTNTGGGANNTSDHSAYIAELLSGLPSACTVTWTPVADDENVGLYIEIIAASGTGAQNMTGGMYPQMIGGMSA